MNLGGVSLPGLDSRATAKDESRGLRAAPFRNRSVRQGVVLLIFSPFRPVSPRLSPYFSCCFIQR